MNKKLISLAVAAALVAPAAAMAEAVLYGKVNVSLDYVDVTNAVLPSYNMSNATQTWGNQANAAGTVGPVQNPADPIGATWTVAPGGVTVSGQDFSGWGMANGYVPNAVTYGVVPNAALVPASTTGTVNVRVPGADCDRQSNCDVTITQVSAVNAATLTGIPLPLLVTSQGGGRANRVGVKGSEELGGGLKAIYQIELGINATDQNGNVANNADAITMRNTFVGLAGGWGTALMGRHDTPLKISTAKLDLFADTLADMNGTVGFHDLRADNAVAYISPSFSGFTFAAAIVPAGGSTALGTNTLNPESDGINTGWSLAGIYSNGPFYGSVAYESLSYNLFNTSLNNAGCTADTTICTTSDNDWNKWRFGIGLLDWNGFTLDAIYESQSGIAGSDVFTQGTAFDNRGNSLGYTWVLPFLPNKMDLWQIQAGYSFGNSMVKAMYGATTFDSDSYVADPLATAATLAQQNDILNGDRTTWAVGYDYSFSKRTKVYALYTNVTDDRKDWIAGSEWDGFSLGMMHSF